MSTIVTKAATLLGAPSDRPPTDREREYERAVIDLVSEALDCERDEALALVDEERRAQWRPAFVAMHVLAASPDLLTARMHEEGFLQRLSHDGLSLTAYRAAHSSTLLVTNVLAVENVVAWLREHGHEPEVFRA